MNAQSEKFVTAMVAWLNARFAPEGFAIDAETLLFANGLINSIRVLEVIAWTEEAIGSQIPDLRVRMDNFRSVSRIAQVFVEEGADVAA